MFNKLAKEINENARSKGFWNSMDLALMQLDYDGSRKSTKDAFIAQKVALVMSEGGEALEAMRKGDYEANGYGLEEKDSFADELADMIIRLLDLCGELDIDIDKQIEWKMKLNKSREALHGKAF